jgi:tetratricopeptide (TPR) repeat protein
VHRTARTLLAIVPVLCAPLAAQNAPSPVRLQADSAFARKDFPRAATLYQQIVAAAPENGGAWNALGASWYQMGKFAQAADAYEHAFRSGAGPFARYNAAASHARAGNAAGALTTLDSLARGGFALPVLLQGDSDFVALRPDPRYQSALAMMQRNATPCASEPKARQLDFWVGEWDVTSPRGPVGRSSVQLILGSCIVFENWAGRLGDSGKSFNVYNAATDEWQQYWVANRLQGANLFTQGIYADGKLQYRHSEFKGSDGKMYLRRLAFFNLDPEHVRQLSERSADGGATWTTEYDFKYTRRH